MKLEVRTTVNASLEQVKEGFTRELFLQLNPPFPPVRLLEFGGCKTGDRVQLELNFLLFKQVWISDITEEKEEMGKWYFVDQGTKLPFFLKSWKHHHEVRANEEGTTIVDSISFATGTRLTDLIMYFPLYAQFLYRKPIYRKLFR